MENLQAADGVVTMDEQILTQEQADGLVFNQSGWTARNGSSLAKLLRSHALLLAEYDRMRDLLHEAAVECREHNREYGHVTNTESLARWERAAGPGELFKSSSPREPAAVPPEPPKSTLFRAGEFHTHSGQVLNWKIECDALTDDDLETVAAQLATLVYPFTRVVGVPDGGLRLARAMEKYCGWPAKCFGGVPAKVIVLLVDDVLTTGASMEAAREMFHCETKGAVIFARGPCPSWVMPLFTLTQPRPMDLDSARRFLLNTIEWLGNPDARVNWHDVRAAIRVVCPEQ